MRILGLTKTAFLFGVLFTVIEIITMVLWLALALQPTKHVVAIVILSVGLLVEHTVSLLAGKFNTF